MAVSEDEIIKKIEENNKKLDEIYQSVEKIKKYFIWSAAVSVLFFVLPLVGLVLIIPWFLSVIDYSSIGL